MALWPVEAPSGLTDGFDRVRACSAAGGPDGEVAVAYLARELLREVYDTRDPYAARRALEACHTHCTDDDIHELTRPSRTIRRWEPPILGWHRTGLANVAVESTNLVVKIVTRLGCGFRNFHNYRLRLRGGAPWQQAQLHQCDPATPAWWRRGAINGAALWEVLGDTPNGRVSEKSREFGQVNAPDERARSGRGACTTGIGDVYGARDGRDSLPNMPSTRRPRFSRSRAVALSV